MDTTIEKNFAKLWEDNKNHQLTSSEMLIYLFLTYQWKKNNLQKFIYSDYKIAKELKLSRQTIIESKKKLRRKQLLDFSHNTGMPTVYSFPDFKEVEIIKKKSSLKTTVNYKIRKDTPTRLEFLDYVKSLPQYKEYLLSDILNQFEKLEQEDWITPKGKISDWKVETKRIVSRAILLHLRK